MRPVKVIRVGQVGRYPRKALAIFSSVEHCERVLEKAEQVKLANNVFIMRDRTYNQREEARLFRLEREKEENEEPSGTQAERGRARRRGRPPGRDNGSVRERGAAKTRGGAKGPRGARESRKRKNSEDDDVAKRLRTSTITDHDNGSEAVNDQEKTPTRAGDEPSARPATPHPIQPPLSAAEGGNNNF